MGIFGRSPNFLEMLREADFEGLIEALHHKRAKIRGLAAGTLGMLMSSAPGTVGSRLWELPEADRTLLVDTVVRELSAALRDKNAEVRRMAEIGLGRIEQPQAKKALEDHRARER